MIEKFLLPYPRKPLFASIGIALTGIFSSAYSAVIVLPPEPNYLRWIGQGLGNWDDTTKWDRGILPNQFLDVVILSNADDVIVSGPVGNSGANTLTIGGGESFATLDLSNGGNLSVENYILISGSGDDGILQSNGVTTAPIMGLGYFFGTSGTYSLSGNGVLTITDPNAVSTSVQEYIGYSGTGIFNQSGGIHTIEQGGMVLGWFPESLGTYNLSGSGKFTSVYEVHGVSGSGMFNQTGGEHSVGDLTLGGILQTEGGEEYGEAIYNLSGGSTTAGTLRLGRGVESSGIFNLSGNGSLTVENEIVGHAGSGIFNQTGGSHQVNGTLTLALEKTSTASYSLGGGVLNTADVLVGNSGTATFEQSGGTHNVGGTLTINSGNDYQLSGGELNAANLIIRGSFIQSGGVSSGTFSNESVIDFSGGSFNADLTNTGTFNLNGTGTRELGGDIVNRGQFNIQEAVARITGTLSNENGGILSGNELRNEGAFNFSGGDVAVSRLTNLGTVNLSGAGTRIFNGDVSNRGRFNVIETNVVFNGRFDNQGVYFSDPSVNVFNDLNVGSNGYLIGGAGDQFIVQGDFTNSSAQNVNWNTFEATLIFDNPNGPATHLMSLASADLGPALTGFDNNFAWGEVVLESGQRLRLVDGNSTPGAALYASRLILPNGISQLDNISGDYNIYYDPALSSNQYLGGSVFNFGSGLGQLIPEGFSFLTTDPLAEGFTFNESSYAQALNTACPQATGALALRCRELRILTPAQRADAIESTTPTQAMAQTISPIKFNFARMEAPMLRMAQLRRKHSQASTFSVNGHQMPLNFSVAALGLTALGGGAGDDEAFANSFRDDPFGLFIDGKFTVGNQRENENNFGFAVDSRAVTIGADYRVNDDLIVGAAMEYMNVNTIFDKNAGSMDSDTYMGAIYGSYRLPQDFYVDALATYGSSEHALTRTFRYPGFSGSATSNPDADQYTVAVSFGKDIAWREWQFNPYARYEYLQLDVEGYRENGGAGLAVDVDAQSTRSSISTLGTQVSYNLSQSWGILIPSVWAEWEHQYLDNNERISMRLSDAAAGTGNFVLQTGKPDRDYANLGASLAASLPEGKSAFIRYEARIGQTDISNHVVEVGIRIPF